MRGLFSITIVAVVLMVGCQSYDFNGASPSGNGSSTSSTVNVTPAVIDTAIQGSQAASATAQSRELVLTSTQLFKDLAEIGLGHLSPTLATSPTGTITCADGGSYTYSGTYTAPNTYNLGIDFNGCRKYGFQLVGAYRLTGTPGNARIVLSGTPTFNIFNFNTSYTTLLAYLKTNVGYTVASDGILPLTAYTITASGSITTFDYFLLNTYTMTLSSLTSSVLESANTNLDLSKTLVTNGRFAENWYGTDGYSRVAINFTDFTVNKTQINAAVAPTTNYSTNTKSVDGRVSFTFTPAIVGYSGNFDVVTLAPIRYLNASPLQTSQGSLNTNGTSTTSYNAGSDVDIIVTSLSTSVTSTLNFPREYELMKISDFAAMEQDKPPLIAPPAPGVPYSLPTGSTLAVTLTWIGPTGTSTSDMDLHLQYFSTTAPTAGTAKTWTVHWKGSHTCSDPAGLAFSTGLDLDGDTVCDAGLDFDDTNGYGPEHITDLKLLPGYYIAAVDSYALAEVPTTLYLSLHIGDNIFGPYISTVSSSDGDGASASAWYHVADIRVNLDGTIDVLSPDPTLLPYD